MSISKAWIEVNYASVLALYKDKQLLTVKAIAERLHTREQNILGALKLHLPGAEFLALKRLRYSMAKMGKKNPMWGKFEQEHHNWKGLCEDGYGYLTILWKGRRHFAHHVVVLEALGLRCLPKGMEVHHIDSNPKNNALDNLALVTACGHRQIHYLQVKDSLAVQLKKSSIAEAVRYLTSQ